MSSGQLGGVGGVGGEEPSDGDISYSVCSVWGLVLGQVYCHYDCYNFSRDLQGGPK